MDEIMNSVRETIFKNINNEDKKEYLTSLKVEEHRIVSMLSEIYNMKEYLEKKLNNVKKQKEFLNDKK